MGLGVREFWGLCPCELGRVTRAARWKWDRLRDRILSGAWAVERLSRLGELPSMQDTVDALTGEKVPEPKRPVTAEQGLDWARRFVTAMGGTIIERKKERTDG